MWARLSPIPEPDFYPSLIPDAKQATKEKGKKYLSYLFLLPQISQNGNFFYFEQVKKKIGPIYKDF
jgi:hypothetical protein